MKGLLVTILFFSILTTISVGQNNSKIDYGLDILKQAESFFCKGDTIQTIKTLENYIDQFPNLGTTLLVSKRLAELYLATDKSELAISLLTKMIDIKPIKGYYICKDNCGLYNGLDHSTIKADLCVILSKTYTLRGDNLTALQFLNLADTKYLPSYGGCANGMIMYKTKLSLDFADLYLLTGDTTKAIDRLIEYFLSNESYDDIVTNKLKSILLLSYSQPQITTEINNGLNTMRIVKGQENEDENILLITFFGRTVKKRAYKDLKFYKERYPKYSNILTLMNG
jgi:tetratricopeptide (TPR) repeat protein